VIRSSGGGLAHVASERRKEADAQRAELARLEPALRSAEARWAAERRSQAELERALRSARDAHAATLDVLGLQAVAARLRALTDERKRLATRAAEAEASVRGLRRELEAVRARFVDHELGARAAERIQTERARVEAHSAELRAEVASEDERRTR